MKIALNSLSLNSLALSLGSCAMLLASLPAPHALAQNPPKRVHAQMDGFEVSSNAGKSANQIGGASRGLGGPQLYAPHSGKAFTTLPTFYWGSADVGEKATFKLSTADGQPLYETVTTSAFLKYPADAPSLMPGSTYVWTVKPENDLLGGAPAPATVMIIGAPDRAAIEAELKTAATPAAKATVFVNHRLWYDSIAIYSDALEANADDQQARTMRAELYDQLPATKSLADADWRLVH